MVLPFTVKKWCILVEQFYVYLSLGADSTAIPKPVKVVAFQFYCLPQASCSERSLHPFMQQMLSIFPVPPAHAVLVLKLSFATHSRVTNSVCQHVESIFRRQQV